jgi:hypothetical protein
MTMEPVGERFAENATLVRFRKRPLGSRPLLAVDLKGSTPRAIV